MKVFDEYMRMVYMGNWIMSAYIQQKVHHVVVISIFKAILMSVYDLIVDVDCVFFLPILPLHKMIHPTCMYIYVGK